jgi:hypothetical protein
MASRADTRRLFRIDGDLLTTLKAEIKRVKTFNHFKHRVRVWGVLLFAVAIEVIRIPFVPNLNLVVAEIANEKI